MNKSLIDTDIFSEILKAKNQTVLSRSDAYRQTFGRYTLSALSVAEIVAGLVRAQLDQQLVAFRGSLAALEILPLGSVEADLAGEITGSLAARGDTIGVIDPLIAAVAVVNKLTLVTGNTQHFQRIVALGYPLLLDNWRDA